MLQARQLRACSCRCLGQHHVQHSRTVLVRSAAAVHRPAQTQAAIHPTLTLQGFSSVCNAAAGGVTSSSRSSRAASVVCRDALRPMWAAKQPDETPKGAGGAMARMVTREIAQCDSLVELSDIYDRWSNSFDHIHAAAALVKCGKLPGGARSSLVDRLCSSWLTQLPLAGVQGCANVLWACVRLGSSAVQRLWNPTWEAYAKYLQEEGPGSPQHLSNPLWACAKLRKQPSVDDLQLLVQILLQPAVLSDATPQALANVVWALGEFCKLPGWQGGVSDQEVRQLLGPQQQMLLANASSQVTSNVVLGLASMAGGKAPMISVGFACDCSRQLLAKVHGQLRSWKPQHIANTLWACGELGLADTPFIAAAVAAAPHWLPGSMDLELRQVLLACSELQYRDEVFMQACLQHGLHLLGHQQPNRQSRSSRPLSAVGRDGLAAVGCFSVARLDMQSMAGPARELVLRSGVGKRPATHSSNLNKLWVFHSWLLQHQLLDGRGLAGLLTQQQLQQGAKDAAAFGMC